MRLEEEEEEQKKKNKTMMMMMTKRRSEKKETVWFGVCFLLPREAAGPSTAAAACSTDPGHFVFSSKKS